MSRYLVTGSGEQQNKLIESFDRDRYGRGSRGKTLAGDSLITPSRWSQDRSSVEIWLPAPGVMYATMSGVFSKGCGQHFVHQFDLALGSSSRLEFFGDLTGLTHVEPAGRENIFDWWKDRRDAFEPWLLFQSKIVEMSVALAGLVVGRGLVHSVSDRREFETVLARRVPGFRPPARFRIAR